ncbi:glycosyltransferase [Microbacterium sp. ZW T5_56]|uniref:glycosyltransferase n=1 Tax=Microbacterium sp. ZW T5_56 TaxID=3378081 RepID=UPI003854C605
MTEERAGTPVLSIIVPTFNEAGNVAELVTRVSTAMRGTAVEVIFVDDSTDDTPQRVESVAGTAPISVRLIHRDQPRGGLGGAVLEGIAAAHSDLCVVMDGDLQHPPETISALLAKQQEGDYDVVVASRYTGDGTAAGLSDRMRVFVSRMSTLVTKAMFPIRLHTVSDPMTGFFLLDRTRIDTERLKPRGFKILLEILARQNLNVAEVPFNFAGRHAGESKASVKQGFRFLTQLAYLRFGRMSAFAVIGGIGALANLGIMAGLQELGMGYVWAAIIAAVLTIIGNFLLIERFVFRDMREGASTVWSRLVKSFTFNAVEAVVRIFVIWLAVQTWHLAPVLVAAVTLVIAFVVRYVFHALVVYAPRTGADVSARERSEV